MAKCTVTYACGHSGTRELTGKVRGRRDRIAWLAKQSCPSCYADAQRAKGPAFLIRTLGNCTEIIAHRATFEIKDLLKARGYRFREYSIKAKSIIYLYQLAAGSDRTAFIDAIQTRKAWGKQLPDKNSMEAEILWLGSHGWEVWEERPG